MITNYRYQSFVYVDGKRNRLNTIRWFLSDSEADILHKAKKLEKKFGPDASVLIYRQHVETKERELVKTFKIRDCISLVV